MILSLDIPPSIISPTDLNKISIDKGIAMRYIETIGLAAYEIEGEEHPII